MDAHWGIGNKGELLVSIPGDKRMFKENTTGKVVLGGRKTMEGLPGGTTLKGRTNIVLTHQKDYTFGDAIVVHSKEEALERLKEYNDEDIFIIGGEKVYRDFLPYCKKAASNCLINAHFLQPYHHPHHPNLHVQNSK